MTRKLSALLSTALICLGLVAATAGPAQANASCPTDNICTYPCYLSGSCTPNHVDWASRTSCINVGVDSNIYSVKNNTNYRYKVWHVTTCSGTPDSYFYAKTSGNMNWEFRGDGIGSYQRG